MQLFVYMLEAGIIGGTFILAAKAIRLREGVPRWSGDASAEARLIVDDRPIKALDADVTFKHKIRTNV